MPVTNINLIRYVRKMNMEKMMMIMVVMLMQCQALICIRRAV